MNSVTPGRLTFKMALLFLALPGFAQQFRFDQLSIANGLTSNTVYTTYQDSFGRMWFGTLDGLNRYDGYTIHTYRHNQADSTSIPHNRITTIYEDHTKQLWLYDEYTSTVIRHDLNEHRFEAYYLDKVAPGPLEVSSIFEDEKKQLRIHSRNGYSLLYNPAKNRFELETLTVEYSLQNSLSEHSSLLLSLNEFLAKTGSPFNKETIGIHKIIRDKQNRYWLATHFDGLYTATESNGKFIFKSHLHSSNRLERIRSEEIYDIFEDRSNVIWIGTRNVGVYRYAWDKYKFNLILSTQTKEGLQELAAVRAIVQDKDKNIWVGTNDQGLIKIDSTLATGTRYWPDKKNTGSLAHRFIRSLWIDTAQQVWVGQYTSASVYQPKQNGFKNYYPPPQHGESIRIYDFKPDGKKGIWMAAWDHILHFDLHAQRFSFLQRSSTHPDFTEQNIRDIELSEDGQLWIAVGERGVNIRNGNGLFTSVHYSPSKQNGLPSDNIFDVFRDSKNRIWLATADGLCQFDPTAFSCKTVTVNDGLPANMIYGILEDKAGNLWLSSTRGLSKFNPASGTIRNFDVDDGLQSNEFTENAFYQNQKGTMFFGGIEGLNFFDPDKVTENKQPPIVNITGLKLLDGETTDMSLFSEAALRQKIDKQEAIILHPNQRSISFEFVGIHMVNPRKNKYAHMLEGLEPDWTYHDSNIKFANYTNLEPRSYTFKVKVSNSDGHWSEPVLLTLVIEKPLYAKTWFRTMVGVLILCGGVIGYRLRISALKKQQGLKALQLEMELNFLKNQVNPHFLFNTLNNIYALCQVNSQNAAPMVAKISDMMRYMLYDCKENRVPLEKEIEYLKNFIDLHQLKSRKPLNVTLKIDGNAKGVQVAPLLLINFLENSFKHGNVQIAENGFVNCMITIRDNSIRFEVRNSYQNHLKFDDKHTQGIGLSNVKHRLDLLYPNKYDLIIHDKDGTFEVMLIITDI